MIFCLNSTIKWFEKLISDINSIFYNEFFSIVKSNKVYFGEKDFQQLKIIEKFIQEKYKFLEIVLPNTVPVTIVPLPFRLNTLSI